MTALQELLTFLRGLPEVAELEFAVKQLGNAGWDEDEAEAANTECYRWANCLQLRLESLGIKTQSQWGEGGSWSVRLETNDCTLDGRLVPGPIIADCRRTVGSYFSE